MGSGAITFTATNTLQPVLMCPLMARQKEQAGRQETGPILVNGRQLHCSWAGPIPVPANIHTHTHTTRQGGRGEAQAKSELESRTKMMKMMMMSRMCRMQREGGIMQLPHS